MNRWEIENFILENFGGVSRDYPWERTPEYAVFRHNDNRKWFAVTMRVKASVLHDQQVDELYPDQEIDLMNLKSEPELVEELVKESGIFPAYHMNKQHWITLVLDENLNSDLAKGLIDASYCLTAKKTKTKS